MRMTKEELPVLIEDGPASVRATDWAGHRAIYVTLPGGFDLTPLVKGLPDDRCQAPLWGYMLKGRMRVVYTDGSEETIRGGDLYYMAPGKTVIVEDDVELVQFGPPEAYDETIEAILRNAEEAAAQAG